MLHKNPIEKAIVNIQVPIIDVYRKRAVAEQSILMPHLVWSEMYESNAEMFRKVMIPSGSRQIADFWNSIEGHPALKDHPMMSTPDWNNMCIPLSIHGDGVPVVGVGKSWAKGVETYSWTSLLCEGTPFMKHWLLIVSQKHSQCKSPDHDTMKKAWDTLAWSFRALFLGKHPSTDPAGNPWPPNSREAQLAGTPLAGGLRGVVLVIRGDLEYFSNTLHLEHFSSAEPCCLCLANRDSVPWNDHRPTAEWRSTCWDDNEVS